MLNSITTLKRLQSLSQTVKAIYSNGNFFSPLILYAFDVMCFADRRGSPRISFNWKRQVHKETNFNQTILNLTEWTTKKENSQENSFLWWILQGDSTSSPLSMPFLLLVSMNGKISWNLIHSMFSIHCVLASICSRYKMAFPIQSMALFATEVF